MRRRTTTRQGKPAPPATATDGAAFMRRFAIDLYDRKDGEAADWQLIAETLFKAGLDAIDSAPDSPRRTNCLNRLQAAAYDRAVGNVEPPATAAALQSRPATGHAPEPGLDLRGG